jgi:LysR family glycine cleavage system transcriptional activator
VPRLGRFRVAHPEIDLRISTASHLVDFAREDVDVGIRMGRGNYPGLRVDRLFGEALTPVCAPALLEGSHPLRRPEDLRHHVLLHEDDATGWQLWLEIAGVEGVDPQRGPIFTDGAMVVQAAAEGQGVALGRRALAAGDLAAGRLVQPFEVSIPYELAYYLVCPEPTAERPKIQRFREWLLAEAAAQEGRQELDPAAARGYVPSPYLEQIKSRER